MRDFLQFSFVKEVDNHVAFSMCAQWMGKKKIETLAVHAKRHVSMKIYPKTGGLICAWTVDNCFKREGRIMPYVSHVG
jgi:hypothetical protein